MRECRQNKEGSPPPSALQSGARAGSKLGRAGRRLLPAAFVCLVIAAAYACRMLAKFDIGGPAVNHIRTALYLLLFTLWGFSLDRRIIQRQALHCLRLTAALILLWLLLRTLKYSVVTGLTAARYVWYLYYLPMLFLPLLGVYIALLLGKPEEYRLSRRAGLLSVIPAALFLLVLTNDLHQQVFAFEGGVPGLPVSGTYSHRLLYYLCLGWMVGCMAFSLACLFRKSRSPGGKAKRITPFVIGCGMLLYGLLYLTGIPAVRWWLGDMNVVFCLLYAAIYESCIRCRMIPSNTGYAELFEATTLAACIADRSGQIVLRSRAAGEEMVCPQEGRRILRPDGIRISSAPISGGYAVWQDNVRPLAELRAQLQENKAEMERNKKKLQDAYLVQKSLHELTEKNRIYNELEAKHSRQTAQLRRLLARCEGSASAERRGLLKRVLLLGTYIKRSANLYFLSSEYQRLPQQELRLTIDEAARALTACGTECGVIYRTTGPMRASEVVRLFALLEIVAETTVDDLRSLFISVSDRAMDLSVECAASLSALASPEITVRQEDGLWLIRTAIEGWDEHG